MSYLRVAGADLYYEITGTGPTLLLVPGGTDDTRDFAAMAPVLRDSYTVVSYDGRGISRSHVDAGGEHVSVEILADDAHRLLVATTAEPAYVFGTSSGGQVALALATRAPELVRTLVVHEPPAACLLAADDARRALPRQVRDEYVQKGVQAALEVFVAGSGFRDVTPTSHGSADPNPSERMLARRTRIKRNLAFFLGHIVLPAASYEPAIAALQAALFDVVVGVGDESEGQLAHDAGVALAASLGLEATRFPGGHAGFVSHPAAFAQLLDFVLQAAS